MGFAFLSMNHFFGIPKRHQFSVGLLLASFLPVGCGADFESVERGQYPLPEDADKSFSEPGQYGGVFVLSQSQQPAHFNPIVDGDAYTSETLGFFMNGLVTYNPITEEHIPELAKKWEIGEDNKTYTFHLRRGLRWSDGEPLTADDVIFTFDAIYDERFPNRSALQYRVAGQPFEYEKIDEHTVEFRTAEVYSPFINDIGWAQIMPRHVLKPYFEEGTLQRTWTSETAINEPEKLVGTGPFRIKSYRPGERLILEPNPHYWRVDEEGQRLPYVDYLIIRYVSDQNTETIQFATGQSDFSGIPASDVAWVRRTEEMHDFTVLNRGPSTGISFIWFNLNPGKNSRGEPFVEPHKLAWFEQREFRQAILHGLDRPGLVRASYFGRGEPLHSVISPGNTRWHNPEVPQYDYDPGKAQEMLKGLGFRYEDDGRLFDAEGNRVEFSLLVSEGSAVLEGLRNTFRENMADLGIRVEVRSLDFSALRNRIGSSFQYEAATIGFTGGGDPSGGAAMYRSDGSFHVWHPMQPEPATEWEARIDEIMDLQERELDHDRRKELFDEMQMIMATELPLLFLVTPTVYAGIQNKWQNIQVPPSGSLIWNLDEIWKEAP